MDEVLAIWNQATDTAKKMIPRITWDVAKVKQSNTSKELKSNMLLIFSLM